MHYYNENDPTAAAWLLGLMEDGLIPEGKVDVRSITEVQAADLVGFAQWHFFAGISGWVEALRIAGWHSSRGVITGSCPCQPFSNAGKQAGEKDKRHLWPEFARIIRIIREQWSAEPPPVMGEQVASKLGRSWLSRVRLDLEGMGYGVWAADLCSASIGSPNIRQRLYWMAYSGSSDGQRGAGGVFEAEAGISGENRKLDGDRSVRPEHGGQAQPVRLGDTNDSGLQGRGIDPERAGERSAGQAGPSGFWGEYDIAPCRDGKSRRIPKGSLEPGLQRMAHGLQPGMAPLWYQGHPLSWEKIESRPAILKGLGNAINPWLAATFIRSFMEDI